MTRGVFIMRTISNQTFDEERALYGETGLLVRG